MSYLICANLDIKVLPLLRFLAKQSIGKVFADKTNDIRSARYVYWRYSTSK